MLGIHVGVSSIDTSLSRGRRLELMLMTAWAMTASTFQLFVIVVLASTLIDDLDLARWQIGLLGAMNTGVGALGAPRLGRLADRLGAHRSMVVLVVVSTFGYFLTALAVNYPLLMLASLVSGISQGACNPVTNKMIAQEVPTEHQGSVTGVKQSGVQFAVFLSGAVIPTAAVTIGWRWAVGGIGLFTLATAFAMSRRFQALGGPDRSAVVHHRDSAGLGLSNAGRADGDAGGKGEQVDAGAHGNVGAHGDAGAHGVGVGVGVGAQPSTLDPFVKQVAVYALLLGMTAGGITRFYPLFAQESLGFSEQTAGLAVSVTGLSAIGARLLWARLLDKMFSVATALRVLAFASAFSAGLLLLAENAGSWILWPAVISTAFSVVAWNVVAMLAVIRSVPASQSGRATGVVLFGFLGGLTVSAPLVGLAIDRFDSYRPAWVVLGLLALAGAVVVRPAAMSNSAVADAAA